MRDDWKDLGYVDRAFDSCSGKEQLTRLAKGINEGRFVAHGM